MGIFDWFKKQKKSNDVVEKFEEFSKSIDTSSFSETQKKATEKFFSDIKKNIKDGQTDTKSSNEVEDTVKNEYYDNGRIKKETEKSTVQNLYTEKFYDENGVLKKMNHYTINKNRLLDEYIYDDSENYQHNLHYEGGEIRKSFYVDGLQEGIEKVFDKNGNLIEEQTYKSGRNTYYKRFIDGKVSEESVKEEELTEDEVEIMQIAKSIDTSSKFVGIVEILPYWETMEDFEGESYYDVIEDFAVLLKNGKEVARGNNISHNFNYWRDDEETHEPQLYNEVMIVNGKQFTDYDDRRLESEKVIATFWNDSEAEEFFNEYIKIRFKFKN